MALGFLYMPAVISILIISQKTRRHLELGENELDEQIVDLPETNSYNPLNLFRLRATKHQFTNQAFDHSPNLVKVRLLFDV